MNDRRVSTRKPLPISVYVIADGVRHPGTMRDLSMAGAGFSDPVLAVRLEIEEAQDVVLEIPPDEEDDAPIRLPGVVVHSSGGLRPRLGIKFGPLDAALSRRLIERLGRAGHARAQTQMKTGGGSSGQQTASEMNMVLIEPNPDEKKGRAVLTSLLVGTVIVAAFILTLVLLSKIEL
jgi:hypothetical protein